VKNQISKKAMTFLQRPSPIREIMDFADPQFIKSLGLNPKDLISFAGGFVGHHAPISLSESYEFLIRDSFDFTGEYSPTLGFNECKEAIIQFEQILFNVKDLKVANVAIGSSSTQLFYALILCLMNPGEKILLLDPTYCNYPIQSLTACDIEIIRFPVLNTQLWEYEVNEKTDDLSNFILKEQPKVVILISPDNPTSQILPTNFVKRAREAVEKIDSFLILDFAYKTLTFTEEIPEYFSWAPSPNFLSIHSNSKWAKNLGRRMGWVEAPEFIIDSLRSIQNSLSLSPDTLHQLAFTHFIDKVVLDNNLLTGYISEIRDFYKKTASFVEEEIKTNLKLPYISAQSAPYICIKTEADSVGFVKKVLEATNVLFVPGWGFGNSMKKGIRLSFGPLVGSFKKIHTGLERVGKFLHG